jgi:hypothetical protein
MLLRSILQRTATATADTQFNLSYQDLWFARLDIYVSTNPAYIGDISNQGFPLNAGDVFTFDHPVNLSDVYFKNLTSGSNTTIIVFGPLLTKEEGKTLGIDVQTGY